MKMTGIVNENGYYKTIVDCDYSTKKRFAEELRGNGYKVVCCLTDEDIEKIRTTDNSKLMQYSERTIAFVRECME